MNPIELALSGRIMDIHTRFPLTVGKQVIHRHWDAVIKDAESQLADSLIQIPGVIHVLVWRYKARLTKAPLFQWDEILPRAIGLIQESMGV